MLDPRHCIALALLLPFLALAAEAAPPVRRALEPEALGPRLRDSLVRLRADASKTDSSTAPRAIAVQSSPRQGSKAVSRWSTAIDRQALIADAWRLSRGGYSYVFGGESPEEGGFDCSGVIYHLLGRHGVRNVPRVAYEQYRWLEGAGNLNRVERRTAPEELFSKLQPGDLLFWEGTYQTGRSPNVSHVMLYLGRDPSSGVALMFGARSGSLRGRHGNAVDVFEFKFPKTGGRGRLIGWGGIPAVTTHLARR